MALVSFRSVEPGAERLELARGVRQLGEQRRIRGGARKPLDHRPESLRHAGDRVLDLGVADLARDVVQLGGDRAERLLGRVRVTRMDSDLKYKAFMYTEDVVVVDPDPDTIGAAVKSLTHV